MNPDAFEQQLQRRALPPLPPEWRAEILGAAAEAREEQERTEVPAARRVSWKQVRWGALAAVWVGIVCISNLDPAERSTAAVAGVNPVDIQERWQAHLRLVAGLAEFPEVQPPLPPPPPHSGCLWPRMKTFA